MALTSQTIKVFVYGMAAIALLLGIGMLGFVQFDMSGLVLAILLVIITLALVFETIVEDHINVMKPRNAMELIAMILIALTGLMAILSFTYGMSFLPIPIKGAMGLVLVFDGIDIVFESL